MFDTHDVSETVLFSSVIRQVTVLTGIDVSFIIMMTAVEFTEILPAANKS
jgi:hypothetical protein